MGYRGTVPAGDYPLLSKLEDRAMCGILGIYHADRLKPVDGDVFGRMLASLSHRGPDGEGSFRDDNILLGHKRLSIIDLSSGAQPMSNTDGTIQVCVNGEIFNYRELKADLVKRGHSFKTTCDIEVIPHLYEEYGLDLFEHMEGQFAIALWNSTKKTLILARDRFGIAPLFYCRHEDSLVFSSEIKAMLPLIGRRELSPEGMAQVFTFWNTIAPRTVFKDINQLRPGECMVIKEGTSSSFIYWDLTFPDDGSHDINDEDKAATMVREILDESASMRLRADVPVGAYLSGGLDSSIITCLVKKYSPGMKTFSMSFTDPRYDESSFQESMGRSLGTHHHVRRITYEDIGDIFNQVVWHTETPVLRSAPAPMFHLSELVRESDIKVILTGEGADEIFGGYDIFKETLIRRFWSKSPSSKFRPLLLFKLYPHAPLQLKRSGRMLISFYREDLNRTDHFGYSHLPTWRTTSSIQNYFTDAFRETIGDYDPVEEVSGMLPAEFSRWHPLNRAQYLEMKLLLAGYLLCSQGERMTMAHSVEGRYPFLNHKLAEFASCLSPRLKIKGLKEKYILKKAFEPELPQEIFSRTKRPYGAPNKEAFFRDGCLRENMVPFLERDAFVSRSIFDADRVERLVTKCAQSDLTGFRDNSALLGILSTQILLDKFCS
jgi:asparagine synthase (glutamine-hydrolysing)